MHIILLFVLFFLAMPAMATQTSHPHHPDALIESLKNDAEAGKKIYQEFCITCHAKEPQIPLGAPRAGVKSDWEPHLKDKKLMMKRVQEGHLQMPPRGGCFECTDELLQAATDYMLPKEKKSFSKH